MFDDLLVAIFYAAVHLLGGMCVGLILAFGVWDIYLFALRAYAEVKSRMGKQLREALEK